jgi:hypothetical protein
VIVEGQRMMDYMQADLQKRMFDRQRHEAEAYAANWRLGQAARRARFGWLGRQRCWLLCQIGQALVWSGRRLQRYGAWQAS